MIATLPMYDRPETRDANDRFWNLIRQHLPDAPEALSRDGMHWVDPDLILSQTCSLPYRTALQDDVAIVATPVHNLSCPAGSYFSAVVVRADDPRETLKDFGGCQLAINSPVSQSGWAAIDQVAQDARITFAEIIETGAHQDSARAVAEGHADICAIDAVSWTMIERWDPFSKGLRVLLETAPTPALPYICSRFQDAEAVQDALVSAVHELSPDDQEALCLIDMTHVPADYYSVMPIPPAPRISRVLLDSKA